MFIRYIYGCDRDVLYYQIPIFNNIQCETEIERHIYGNLCKSTNDDA